MFPTRSRIESATCIARGRVTWRVTRHAWTLPVGRLRVARPDRVPIDRVPVRRSRPRPDPRRPRSPAVTRRSTAAACTHAPVATCSARIRNEHGAGPRGRRACAGRRPTGRRRRRAGGGRRGHAGRGERVETVEQPAHHALERRTRADASRVTSERSPMIATGRVGPVGYALAVEVRDEHGRVRRRRPGLGRASASASSRARRRRATAPMASVTFVAFSVHTSGRKRPVASANARDRAGRVGGRRVAHREHRARRPDRDDDVARARGRRRARRPCCRRCPRPRSLPCRTRG